MKKPILASLVLVRALLKLFRLKLSTTFWSREFHLSMTLSAKKEFVGSCPSEVAVVAEITH